MTESLLNDPAHREWLIEDARRHFEFFRASLGDEPGFRTLERDGTPREDQVQELHWTTRNVHSYALGMLSGWDGAAEMVDKGMDYLWSHHRDREHGGYINGIRGDEIADGRKLAYGHVFVLLAGSTAKVAGHPDADRLIADVSEVLDDRYWEESHGRFADEFNRDWTPFSDYRGMNANMHGAEALMAAYEATGDRLYLDRAERIVSFFVGQMAPEWGWRIPEHYRSDWSVDRDYAGDPMFRPAGITPGHSLEWARLTLQLWDLTGREDDGHLCAARSLVAQALSDGWDEARGGLYYTVSFDGTPDVTDRYWWPVTEGIGALASLLKIEGRSEDDLWYRRLWDFAKAHFVDEARGGWFPEIDDKGRPTETQFFGKPDIYHSLQADLFPLTPGLSRQAETLPKLKK